MYVVMEMGIMCERHEGLKNEPVTKPATIPTKHSEG